MTITLTRKWIDTSTETSIAGDDKTEMMFLAHADDGERDEDVDAFCQLDVNLSQSYNGKGIVGFRVEATEHDELFNVVVNYESRTSSQTLPRLNEGEVRWSVKTAKQGTAKKTYSRSLVSESVIDPQLANAAWKFSGTASERVVGLRIGTGGKGYEIEGKDIGLGTVIIDVQTVVGDVRISSGYLVTAALHAAQEPTNSAIWNGFPIGTLRLIDYAASPRSSAAGDPEYDVNFALDYQPNLTGLSIASEMPAFDKKGHELLDVMYKKKVIQGIPLSVPVRAAVHEWYPEIDLATVLGI